MNTLVIHPMRLFRALQRKPALVALAAFSCVYLALQVTTIRARSATYDEPVHLAAGFAALTARDFRLDPAHPPLLRLWAALPLLAGAAGPIDLSRLDREERPFSDWDSFRLTNDFLFRDNDGHALLGRARFMTALLGLALGALLFVWVREWLGPVPAALTLLFYALSPNLSAHAGLVTTDLGATLFFTAAIYFFWRLQRAWTMSNLGGLAAAFSLAVVSKFSALALAPILAILVCAVLAAGGITLTARRSLVLCGVLAVSAWAAIWAAYGFQFAPAPGMASLRADLLPGIRESWPKVAAVAGWVDGNRLLPSAYTQGFLHCHFTAGESVGYLAGRTSEAGWWYYFPAAFLLKTPVMFLLLLAGGLVALVRPGNRLSWVDRLVVFVPPAVFMALAMTSRINIGLRHVLPVYPFALLAVAAAARGLLASGPGPVRAGLAAGALLWAAEFAVVFPHTLTFFNHGVGGPRKGPDYLVDSNLDWGQHLKALDSWMEAQGVERMNLAYFGFVDPRHYGIEGVALPGTMASDDAITAPELPGYVAISPTIQAGAGFTPQLGLLYEGFRELEPVATIGNSIRVYRVDRWPFPPPPAAGDDEAIARRLELAEHFHRGGLWIQEAIQLYRAHLSIRPADGAVACNLGDALLMQGNAAEALAVFREAVARSARPGKLAASVADILARHNLTAAARSYAKQSVDSEKGPAAVREFLRR